MRELNYDLVISDFDGTLASSDDSISEENKRAIEKYREEGGNFVISTGRLHYSILKRARELGLKGLISCCQGAVIVDAIDGKRILDERLPFEATYKTCKKLVEEDKTFLIYDSEEFYANRRDEYVKIYESIVKETAIVMDGEKLLEFIEKNEFRSYKILVIVEPKENESVLNMMKDMNINGCSVTKSAEFLVEIINSKFSKGTAVEYLAKYYNTSIERTIAIGDQLNDLSMIEKAGLGVAVKNASDALKEHAFVLDKTNDENAIKEVIERFAYKK